MGYVDEVLDIVSKKNADQLLNHNMLLLLSVGLLMLARLSFDKAERQAGQPSKKQD